MIIRVSPAGETLSIFYGSKKEDALSSTLCEFVLVTSEIT